MTSRAQEDVNVRICANGRCEQLKLPAREFEGHGRTVQSQRIRYDVRHDDLRHSGQIDRQVHGFFQGKSRRLKIRKYHVNAQPLMSPLFRRLRQDSGNDSLSSDIPKNRDILLQGGPLISLSHRAAVRDNRDLHILRDTQDL